MIIPTILGVLVLVLVIGIAIRDRDYELMPLSLLFSLLAFLTGMIPAVIITGDTTETIEDYKLEAISSGTNVSGSFFILGGTVKGQDVFSCYIDGGDYYKKKSYSCNFSKIVYSADRPHMKVVRNKISVWGWGLNRSNTEKVEYIFYVPKGSIVKDYTLK